MTDQRSHEVRIERSLGRLPAHDVPEPERVTEAKPRAVEATAAAADGAAHRLTIAPNFQPGTNQERVTTRNAIFVSGQLTPRKAEQAHRLELVEPHEVEIAADAGRFGRDASRHRRQPAGERRAGRSAETLLGEGRIVALGKLLQQIFVVARLAGCDLAGIFINRKIGRVRAAARRCGDHKQRSRNLGEGCSDRVP